MQDYWIKLKSRHFFLLFITLSFQFFTAAPRSIPLNLGKTGFNSKSLSGSTTKPIISIATSIRMGSRWQIMWPSWLKKNCRVSSSRWNMVCNAGPISSFTTVITKWNNPISGSDLDWQSTGGITKLVNNKMIIYYTDDHNKLRIQVRQGIARILLENILFGDDLGEFAANQTLLDLPTWLTDGYIEYVAENWNTDLDDQLKSAILSGRYTNFYNLAFEKPNLSGHAFWYYFAKHYKKENVTYFLYLARVYRNLNSASMRICKKKFKDVLKDFMNEEEEIYEKDIRGRRNFPKGTSL